MNYKQLLASRHLKLFAILFLVLVLPMTLVVLQQQQIFQPRAQSLPITPTPTLSNSNIFLSGYVYVDQNGNGRRDRDEKGYPGVWASIKQITPTPTMNPTSVITSTTPTPTLAPALNAYTDSLGHFLYTTPTFTKTTKIQLDVSFKVPSGYVATTNNPVRVNDLRDIGRRVIEFGMKPIMTTLTPTPCPTGCPTPTLTPTPCPTGCPTPTPSVAASIVGGYVFIDTNKNGVFDSGESPVLSPRMVTVKGVSSDTTSPNGMWEVFNVPAGTYTVVFTPGINEIATTPTSRTITVPPSQGGINFGIVVAGTISPTRTPTPTVKFNMSPTPTPSILP
jgi:hypothetical protein